MDTKTYMNFRTILRDGEPKIEPEDFDDFEPVPEDVPECLDFTAGIDYEYVV